MPFRRGTFESFLSPVNQKTFMPSFSAKRTQSVGTTTNVSIVEKIRSKIGLRHGASSSGGPRIRGALAWLDGLFVGANRDCCKPYAVSLDLVESLYV
jgi:hypothetical protein